MLGTEKEYTNMSGPEIMLVVVLVFSPTKAHSCKVIQEWNW
jgi:hypothetical protein